MGKILLSTVAASLLSGWMAMPSLSAEDPGARSEREHKQTEDCVEREPVRDVEEALRILHETGELLDRAEDMMAQAGGVWTEESRKLMSVVAFKLRKADLANVKLPDGVLLSDDELIEWAIKGIQKDSPHLAREDIVDLPPQVEWRWGRRRVAFPAEQRLDWRGGWPDPAIRFEVDLHPATGKILTIGLSR